MATTVKAWNGDDFNKLAVLINAGLDIATALTRLAEQGVAVPSLVQKKVAAGKDLATCLKQHNLINQHQFILLNIAQASGKLAPALTATANQQLAAQRRIQRLRGQLYFPLGVFVLAMLLTLMVRVFGVQEALISVLWDIAKTSFMVWLGSKLLFYFLRLDGQRWISLCWRLHLVKSLPMAARYCEYHWCQLLLWQLEAGQDFNTALNHLGKTYTAVPYQRAVSAALELSQQGCSMALCLIQSDLIGSTQLQQILHSAETAGSVTAALGHHLNLQAVAVQTRIDEIYTWIPRLYYLFILLMALPMMPAPVT